MKLPGVALRSQADVWRCAVTALEYVTGIDREEIAKQLGHDGGSRPESIAKRFCDGTSVFADAFAYVGVLGDEIQWWAACRDLSYFVLNTREHLSATCEPAKVRDILHPLVSVPTSVELMGFLQGKSAIVTVPMPDTPDRRHLVAWLGTIAIDPMHGMARELDATDVLGAMIFPGIDPDVRLRALYGKALDTSAGAPGGGMA